MDRVGQIEAAPINTEMDTISKAELWLADASERVSERCELYRPPKKIESEAQRKECAAARTRCRRDAARIDGERKALLRGMEDVLKKFKLEVKDVLSPLTDLDIQYKHLLDEYDEARRAEREAQLAQKYAIMAPDLFSLVPFERLMQKYGNGRGKVWTNRSTSIEAAKLMMRDAVVSITQGEQDISGLADPEDIDDIKARFFETLDLQGALADARHAKEQRERVRQMEAARAAREQARPVAEPTPVTEGPVQSPEDVPHAWVVNIPSATKAQMCQLAKALNELGLSGTIRDARR
ncbi:MAG: hypothetical protein Q4C09_02740 [Atopobiaceae bacterium]|nr:hypothetical protein [Atopobiaceae bacterium]